jgi:hypothetical protein
MASGKELRTKIKSVENTKKITASRWVSLWSPQTRVCVAA